MLVHFGRVRAGLFGMRDLTMLRFSMVVIVKMVLLQPESSVWYMINLTRMMIYSTL